MRGASGRDLYAAILYRQPASDCGRLRWNGTDLRSQREDGEGVCARAAGKGCGVTEVICMNIKFVAHAHFVAQAYPVAQAFLPVFFLAVTLHAAPTIRDIQPRGAQRGKTFTLYVRGDGLTQGAQIK